MSLKTPPSSPSKQSPSEEIIIKIVSASYGPCEGQQLLTGALSNDPSAKIPYTRDVTPILRALLKMQESHASSNSSSTTRSGLDKEDPHLVRLRAISGEMGGMKRTSITIQALQDGWNSMNIVFGDVCPGISKKLYIHYVIFHKQQLSPGKNSSCKQASLVASEVHHVNFAENEPVLLRRRVTFYQEDSKLQQATARVVLKKGLPKDATSNVMDANFGDLEDGGDEDERTLRVARRMGRSDSIIEFAQLSVNNNATQNAAPSPQQPAIPPKPKRLRSATFEIVLPIALSFLHVPDRVQCRLVCRLWQNILSDIGVASVIDSSDPTFQHAFTRPFLRGILAHSHSSLHSLRLCDFHELCPEDLQASLPHLRKLRVLDISRCIKLQDETLQAVAKYAGATLEVLYIKGLVNVSDAGLIAICESCSKLKVLEVSHIPITDEGGVAMGRLKNLRALYMRDNYKLTNKSVDTITANCKKLIQLTLWGSTKVKHLSFGGMATAAGSASNGMLSPLQSHLPTNQNTLSSGGKLLSLSLWGCFKLGDDIAVALGNLKNLRTLIVSECHKLTDQFVLKIADNLSQLVHLHLRYCKRVTDVGVNAIASGMDLYTLDLSFCSKVTSQSICSLIESRHETLSELRLQECRQLKIVRDPDDDDDGFQRHIRGRNGAVRGGADGVAILRSLRSPTGPLGAAQSNLSMIDLRCCGGQKGINVDYPASDSFVRGMTALQFHQRAPGFFARPAQWSASMQSRLQEQLETHSTWAFH